MVKQWVGAALGRVGIRLRFSDVICAEAVKTIWIEPDWHARVTMKRTLVFTRQPGEQDLSDTYALDPGERLDRFVYDSPDAAEVARTRRGPEGVTIHWRPRARVIRYALYTHQDSWTPPTSYKRAALSAQYRCDMKTGIFTIEFVTPTAFETGVLFRRPRWPRLTSERSLIGYALRQLQANAQKPRIGDNGKRAEWQILEPRIGDRYICVVFHQHGVADWQEQLKETSLVGRARRLVTGLVPR